MGFPRWEVREVTCNFPTSRPLRGGSSGSTATRGRGSRRDTASTLPVDIPRCILSGLPSACPRHHERLPLVGHARAISTLFPCDPPLARPPLKNARNLLPHVRGAARASGAPSRTSACGARVDGMHVAALVRVSASSSCRRSWPATRSATREAALPVRRTRGPLELLPPSTRRRVRGAPSTVPIDVRLRTHVAMRPLRPWPPRRTLRARTRHAEDGPPEALGLPCVALVGADVERRPTEARAPQVRPFLAPIPGLSARNRYVCARSSTPSLEGASA